MQHRPGYLTKDLSIGGLIALLVSELMSLNVHQTRQGIHTMKHSLFLQMLQNVNVTLNEQPKQQE
jgi:hypothetical protein